MAKYPIITIEDGMAEDDWDGWADADATLGAKIQLVGDDLFVTNTQHPGGRHRPEDRQRDPDQAQPDRHADRDAGGHRAWRDKAGYATIVSHRSGETEDTTIADIAVATAATQIKTGSMSRSDRVAKYNQLLRIEGSLGGRVGYAGSQAFPVKL